MTKWRIAWGDHAWTDADLLASDVASVQSLVGGGWETCNPWAGPMEVMAMIATLEARTVDRPVADVLAELATVPAVRLLDAITPA